MSPLTRNQRDVVWIALGLLLAMIAFPPWLHVRVPGEPARGLPALLPRPPVETAAGYAPLWDPPDSSRLDLVRLGLQVLALAALAGWIFWLCRAPGASGESMPASQEPPTWVDEKAPLLLGILAVVVVAVLILAGLASRQ